MNRTKQRAIRAAYPGASKAQLRRLRRGITANSQSDMGHGVATYVGVQTTSSRDSERAANAAARKLLMFFGGGTRKEGKTITTDGDVE